MRSGAACRGSRPTSAPGVMPHIHQPNTQPSESFLDPADRIAEVLFGVIMVLTFTGSLSVAEAGQADVKEMLRGALGCNIAWGVVDGFIFVMARVAERRRTYLVGRAIREAADGTAAAESLRSWLPGEVAALLEPAHLDQMIRKLRDMPQPPVPHARWSDLRVAVSVFLLVVLSTLPVIAPFLFLTEVHQALRLSHGIALTMLFVLGAAYGRITGQPAIRGALLMSGFGVVLAVMTLMLGG
jgi:VIT1/CCC1 family predicted Fe2+/Mn2+ transporter